MYIMLWRADYGVIYIQAGKRGSVREKLLEKNDMELRRKIAQLKKVLGKDNEFNIEKRAKMEYLMKELDITYEDMYKHPDDKEILLLKEYNSYLMQLDKCRGKGEQR